MDDEPSDNVRTAIGVSVGLTSGIVILYYFVRLCRAIARFPKSDSEEALPAYRPPSIPPGTDGSYSHNENTYNNPSAGGHNMSGNNALPSLTDEFHDLRREQVPVNIPTLPSPVYSRPARDSGYYHHGEMTQIGDSSTTLSGTFVIPIPTAPTRPPRSSRRTTGLRRLRNSLSIRTPLLPTNTAEAEIEENEPPPPSYSDVVGQTSPQLESAEIAELEQISESMTMA